MPELQIGKTYRRSDGVRQTVGGRTTANPDWVWTHQGDWFRAEDGRFIDYRPDTGTEPMSVPTWRDLVEEVPT